MYISCCHCCIERIKPLRQISGNRARQYIARSRTSQRRIRKRSHCNPTIRLGNDGVRVSARQICEETGIDLELLEAMQSALGLPRADDPDAVIHLRADGDRGLLRNEDDGVGFNPATLQAKGLGLRIMRYRAQMMAGSLRIESARTRGTIVSCWFPRSAN